MANATLSTAQQELRNIASRFQEDPPGYLGTNVLNPNRVWQITESGIGVQGAVQRLATGITNGVALPAITDLGLREATSIGAIAGGLQGALQGGLSGAIQGGVTGALNNAIAASGIPDALNNAAAQLGVALPGVPGLPALGGVGGLSPSGASGGAAASARAGITRAGLAPSGDVNPARTLIQDASSQEVTITVDSFLQSLQGSLSSIAGAGGIAGVLGGAIQNLLGSTGLTGALGGIVQGLSSGLSNALGGLTQSLGNAAQGLMQGLGNAIKSIPGVGPVLGNMSNAISGFAGNLSTAYGNLPTAAQAGINGAIAAVGANVVNRLDIPGVPRINPTVAGVATAALRFADNPVAQLNQIATTARELDKRTFGETRDSTFANVASAASRASREMQQSVQRNDNGTYQLIQDPEDAGADIAKTKVVKNGELQPTTNSFVDTLNSIQLQSFQTYEKILQSRFISYGDAAPALATQAYREYIEFNSLRTPETKLFVAQIQLNDAQLIKQLADRFLLFYRSSRSRYSLENL
jgi:hypothetical protein